MHFPPHKHWPRFLWCSVYIGSRSSSSSYYWHIAAVGALMPTNDSCAIPFSALNVCHITPFVVQLIHKLYCIFLFALRSFTYFPRTVLLCGSSLVSSTIRQASKATLKCLHRSSGPPLAGRRGPSRVSHKQHGDPLIKKHCFTVSPVFKAAYL